MAIFVCHRKTVPGNGLELRRRGSNVSFADLARRLGAARGALVACTLIAAPAGASLAGEVTGQHAIQSGPQATAPAQTTQPASATAVGGDLANTRFVVGLDRAAEFQVSALSNPNRVVVDLSDVKVQLPLLPEGKPVGLVQSFRGGLSAPGTMRIVIDVAAPVVVESARIEPAASGKGYVLNLEIAPLRTVVRKPLGSEPYGLGAQGLQPPLPLPAERPDQRAARSFKPIIVIDPGHGGQDTGARKNGTVEKEVVLAFSKVLKEQLERTGRYKVLMTRETDVFVDLDERRAFAERHGANLFIAVHADYARTRARGATIYSLRENVANDLKRSARDDIADKVLSADEVTTVKQSSGDVDAVKGILADLARRELDVTQERTSIFSRSVIEYMGASTNLRDDPDKQAAFRVLKTAQFPSVLIELAYVSNKEDAALLRSDAWRAKVSRSIVTAVENYFSHQLARLPL